jgi:hypothetical protein
MIVERLEFTYPVVALRCHDLIEVSAQYLRLGAAKISRQAGLVPRDPDYVRTLPEYYAKLHTVTYLPGIFLQMTAAVWSATDDIPRGLWAIEVLESAIRCALDPVAVAAVEAGVTAGGGDPDANVYEQSIREGLQLIAAATFDTALALIEN